MFNLPGPLLLTHLRNKYSQCASSLEHLDFNSNDIAVKLWLPQKLVAGVDVLRNQHNASRPDVLRWFFFDVSMAVLSVLLADRG